VDGSGRTRREDGHDITSNYVAGFSAYPDAIYRPASQDGLHPVQTAAAYRHTNQVTVDD
jgi:hypothetical protein